MTELSIEPTGWRDCLEMAKPRVLMLLCALLGMFLATLGMVPLTTLTYGLVGIAGVAGSAALVNYVADAYTETVRYSIVYLGVLLLLVDHYIEWPGASVSLLERYAAYS